MHFKKNNAAKVTHKQHFSCDKTFKQYLKFSKKNLNPFHNKIYLCERLSFNIKFDAQYIETTIYPHSLRFFDGLQK